jgi:hypothetical protein
MASYSFRDVTAAIIGPGGSVNLASGSGSSEEGIDIEAVEDTNMMTIGADGHGMHSLIVNESSTVTVRFLKNSPVNFQLQLMYNLQASSSTLHGQNVITVRHIGQGDFITLTGVAFKRRPNVTYAKEGGIMEWAFDAIRTAQILAVGTPEL